MIQLLGVIVFLHLLFNWYGGLVLPWLTPLQANCLRKNAHTSFIFGLLISPNYIITQLLYAYELCLLNKDLFSFTLHCVFAQSVCNVILTKLLNIRYSAPANLTLFLFQMSVSTVSTGPRHYRRSPGSIISSDSDIRFTRKKLSSQYRCGCCIIACFLLLLLLAAAAVYVGCEYTKCFLSRESDITGRAMSS